MGARTDRLLRQAASLVTQVEAPATEMEAIARELRAVAANEEANRPLVSPFAEQHGQYDRVGQYGDARKALVNRGGTPIARWKADGLLSETQALAIDYCIRLWERAGRYTNLVMDLSKIIGQPPSSGWSQQEALDELQWFKERVPRQNWDVFENVCRFDMPTGVAGSHLSSDRKTVNVQARTIVCFVADLIAMWKRL